MRYVPNTIRGQTFAAVSSIMLTMIVFLIWITIYVTKTHLYDLGERDARERVQTIAARAGYAAIIGHDSPDVPAELLRESTVNGILAMALDDLHNQPIARLDPDSGLLASCFSYTPDDRSTVTSRRVGRMWCISAAVFQRTSAAACNTDNCVIAHLRAVVTAEPVAAIVARLIQTVVVIGGLFLIIAFFCLWRVSNAISEPLSDIVTVMRRFAGGDRAARAASRGPNEVVTISQVYNALIDSQEDQARSLEMTVEQRTIELKAAILAAQDAERYKTIFMAHMSHDMRTPLHIIEAQAADVMQELEFGGDIDRARIYLDIIIQQSRELSLRVSQILELTRGQSGPLDVAFTALSLQSLRELLYDKGALLAKERGNVLTLDVADGTVRTDANKVLQIASNLMENACKFTENGTIQVRVHLQGTDLLLSVEDSGRGIPANELDHIWSDFRQVLPADGRRVGGFGLGLSIVRQYAMILRGKCGVESIEGKGTRIWVSLPSTESEWQGRAA